MSLRREVECAVVNNCPEASTTFIYRQHGFWQMPSLWSEGNCFPSLSYQRDIIKSEHFHQSKTSLFPKVFRKLVPRAQPEALRRFWPPVAPVKGRVAPSLFLNQVKQVSTLVFSLQLSTHNAPSHPLTSLNINCYCIALFNAAIWIDLLQHFGYVLFLVWPLSLVQEPARLSLTHLDPDS